MESLMSLMIKLFYLLLVIYLLVNHYRSVNYGENFLWKFKFNKKLKKIFLINQKNLLALLAHSHHALRARLASLARMSAHRARDLMVVALRAPTYVNFALRAQCCALHSA